MPCISSPGMLSFAENVCLGDASVGVARNPLRDGAPPTGVIAGIPNEPFVCRSCNSPRKPVAALHRTSGQRRSTLVTARDALVCGGLPPSYDHGLRHSSGQCSPHLKDDCDRQPWFLPARPETRADASASYVSRGACVAPLRARQTSVTPGSKSGSHVLPFGNGGEAHTFRTLRVTPHSESHVENS